MYSDDANVRKAAATQLEKLVGHPTGLDPTSDADTRAAAIDKLYSQLVHPATQPSTQP
jgi:hypothetical protein